MLVIVMNTATGVVQERRAERAIAELSSLTAPSALVVRYVGNIRIPAENIGPGDRVLLTAGGVVPADGVLDFAVQASVDESTMSPCRGHECPVTH